MSIAMEQTGRDAITSTVDDLAGNLILVAAKSNTWCTRHALNFYYAHI